MKYFIVIYVVLLSSCNTEELIDRVLDITPPKIYKIEAIDKNSIIIDSNETITIDSNFFFSREKLTINNLILNDQRIIVQFNQVLKPGIEYQAEFKIYDKSSNYLSFICKFYGFNDRIPNILINEFITRGTNSNPDKVELYILKGGNIGGITLYSGTRENYDSIFIFPSIEVESGEYIVIRSTSENYLIEYMETTDLNVSFDKKFIDGSRDIRTVNLKLPSNNGVISLYSNPFGEILDAVIYSKNYNDTEKKYRNFGLKKVIESIDVVSEKNQWNSITDIIYPEDTVFIDNSTTTRSLNRENFIDTNSKNDWYTVTTKESSFGYKNSLMKY